MDEPPDLSGNPHWRTAVWALRAGFASLVIGVIGIVLLAAGVTPWALAAGVIGWLICALLTVNGVARAWRQLPEPRPGLWPIRWMLLGDTVHVRSSPGSV